MNHNSIFRCTCLPFVCFHPFPSMPFKKLAVFVCRYSAYVCTRTFANRSGLTQHQTACNSNPANCRAPPTPPPTSSPSHHPTQATQEHSPSPPPLNDNISNGCQTPSPQPGNDPTTCTHLLPVTAAIALPHGHRKDDLIFPLNTTLT